MLDCREISEWLSNPGLPGVAFLRCPDLDGSRLRVSNSTIVAHSICGLRQGGPSYIAVSTPNRASSNAASNSADTSPV